MCRARSLRFFTNQSSRFLNPGSRAMRSVSRTSAAKSGMTPTMERVRSGIPNYPQAPVARIHFELASLYEITGDLQQALRHIRQVPGSRGGTEELKNEAAAVESRIKEKLATQKAQASPQAAMHTAGASTVP